MFSVRGMFRRGKVEEAPAPATDGYAPSVDVEVGRVVAGPVSSPQSYVNPNTPLLRPHRSVRQDVTSLRLTNADDLIKQLSEIDPDMSAGIWNFLRLAESGVSAIAYNLSGKPDQSLQRALDSMLLRASGATDFQNWDIRLTLDQLASQLMRYTLLRGSCGLEAVLGKDRRLYKLVTVDPFTVRFSQTEPGVFKPWQQALYGPKSGQKVWLDIPTFFWQVLDPDAQTPFENPPFLPAVQAILFNMAVMQDLQRIVKRVAYPRISVKVVEATLRKFAPPEIQSDPAELAKWLNQQKLDIGNSLKDIKPEDAAVFFDSVEVGVLESKSNATVDYKPLIQVIDQRVITGLKTLPTILGRQFGSSQTLSGVEALLYAKSVKCVQSIASAMLSRALTLCLRLEGRHGIVRVQFGEVSLRPESELESFRALKQNRVLRNLSLGLITDEEASIELTGNPFLPDGYVRKSGTGFYPFAGGGSVDPASVEASRSPTAEEQAGAGRNRGN